MMVTTDRRVMETLPGLGAARRVAANDRLLLDDASRAWMVTEGEVRIFAVEKVADRPEGVVHPLFSCGPGSVLLGADRPDLPYVLVAVGTTAGDVVRPITTRNLRHLLDTPIARTIVARIDSWVEALAGSVSDIAETTRNKDRALAYVDRNDVTEVGPEHLVVPHGKGIWVRSRDRNDLALWGWPTTGTVPLPTYAWAELTTSGMLDAVDGAAALATGAGWEGLWSFFAGVLELLAERVEETRLAEMLRQDRLGTYEDELEAAVFSDLGQLITGTDDVSLVGAVRGGDLIGALQLVAAAGGFTVVAPAGASEEGSDPGLEAIARASGFSTRKVALTSRWWTEDAGPLLGRWERSGQWVALLPEGPRRYAVLDPSTGERRTVDAGTAGRIAFDAFQLYRALPARRVTGHDMLRFVYQDVRADLWRVLAAAIGIGLLSLVPTFAAEILFDRVVPHGDRADLAWVVSLMVAAAVAAGTLGLYQGILSLRVETKASLGVQAAVFARLLDLPTAFFRRFSSADLAMRSMGIESLREVLSQYTVTTVLAAVAALCNVAVMFVIEPVLALFGALALGLAVIVMVVGFRVMARRQYDAQEAQGQLYSTGVQLLGSVPKLRVAHAERRAFSRWAVQFGAMKRAEIRASQASASLAAFFASFVPLASAFVMVGATILQPGSLRSGSFLAFNTAYTQVVASLIAMSATIYLLAASAPFYKRLRPILEAEVELSTSRPLPGPLRGSIEVSNVSFRYRDDGPLVLEDVSFSVRPGQMVAIVGPSGSGKSSLLRLLLGFDQAEVGTVSFDGQDLTGIDIRAVRRQCGVVIQGTKLMPGDIRYNIAGTRPMPLQDVWNAASIAGVDDYIRSLPMGLDTVINEQGGAFSGGQRQLLLIARALAGKPRVIMLDEATSALDNTLQTKVMRNVEALNATRVVIAHRLSTIRRADKVLVLVAGRLVQEGTFEELTARPGPFVDLVRRQTL